MKTRRSQIPGLIGGANQRVFRLEGFTLIEILLAASASAMIMAAIYAVFVNCMHLRDRATQRSKESRLRARAEALIRHDLENALISGGTLAAVLTATQQAHNSQFPGYLDFTTTTAELADGNVGGDVQSVEYFVDKDPSPDVKNAGILVRTETRNLLAQLQQTPVEQTLLSGVASLEADFYDGQQWQTGWSYAQAGDPLPVAAKVTVTFAPSPKDGTVSPPLTVETQWETSAYMSTTSATTGASGTGSGSGSSNTSKAGNTSSGASSGTNGSGSTGAASGGASGSAASQTSGT